MHMHETMVIYDETQGKFFQKKTLKVLRLIPGWTQYTIFTSSEVTLSTAWAKIKQEREHVRLLKIMI